MEPTTNDVDVDVDDDTAIGATEEASSKHEDVRGPVEQHSSPSPYASRSPSPSANPTPHLDLHPHPITSDPGLSEAQSSTYSPSVGSHVSNPALEVDSTFETDNSDADSAISVYRESSTQSVRSSIYEFVEENGRTFHKYKEGKYNLPNDAIEQDRLDLQHHLMLVLLDGKLNLAPIGKNPQRVLDVGTGTGIWAIEFANKYPSASVTGTDLSPIQPEFVPANCQFEVDDAEDQWIFSTNFDFIHMRGMMTCFSDPKAIIEKAFEACAPGGYLEMQDGVFPMYCHDHTLEGTSFDQWAKMCVEGAIKIGKPWTNAVHYKRWMEEAGFENVKEKIFEVPTSTWPKGKKQKELGMWFQADLMDVLGATMAMFTRVLGWSMETWERFLVDVRKDVSNRAIHAYMPVHIVWGRKPKATAQY